MEIFFNEIYHPGLVSEIFYGGRSKACKLFRKRIGGSLSCGLGWVSPGT
jgi:hypothetical protein